ncbi:MAG: leucine-rich repeat domain-containing protein [Clostridia bacterium]|nr:leucine-rich repeat domain-containing protein [Clostridia bacterium]
MAETATSGTCGDNLTWTLDSDGTLTISGTGPMEDYPGWSDTPWFSAKDNISKIVINKGVTTIGDYAFATLQGVTAISIPEGIVSIGDNSLFITGITEIKIPFGVTEIGSEAFYGCDFTEIIIPDSVTYIGDRVFWHCSNLKDIFIPDSVIHMGHYVLGSNVENTATPFFKNADNWTDGVLYCGNHLIKADADVVSGTYSIKEGTKTIASNAFVGCSSLTGINIPSSVVYIGERAFKSCALNGEIEIPANVTEIGMSAFSNNNKLSAINVSADNNNYISDNGILYNAAKTQLISFPVANSATSITIPDGTEEIPDSFFAECSKLQEIIIPDTVSEIESDAFKNCKKLTNIILPAGITTINHNTFYGCSSLNEIIIPSSVTDIYSNAFDYCSSLRTITIPQSTTSLYNNFSGCTALKELIILNSDCSFYMSNTDLSGTVIFGKSNSTAKTFAESNGLTFALLTGKDSDILISGETNESIAWKITRDGTLTFTNTDSDNLYAHVSKSGWETISKFIRKIVISDGIYSIDSSVFSNLPNLTEVTLPSNLRSIGSNAFYGCKLLQSINIPSAVQIGSSAFCDCSALDNIHIGDNSFIDEYAFYNCSSLKTVNLGKVKTINAHAFDECENLTDVYFKGSVKDWYKIYERRFYGSTIHSAEIHYESNFETKFKQFDKFAFGSYPQSIVTDTDIIEQLNAKKAEWVYIEDSYKETKYAEIELSGNKYRAILDENLDNAVNWFKYEPIIWRVIDPANGLIYADVAIETRLYSDNSSEFVTFENSDIGNWLNSDFYSQAFSDAERSAILTTTIRNIKFSTHDWSMQEYDSSVETIFIPSAGDLVNYMYKFSTYPDSPDSFRNVDPSDYSLNTDVTSNTRINLMTRIIGNSQIYVQPEGFLDLGRINYGETELGVRPAMYVDINNIECNHVFQTSVVAPTCSKEGYTLHKCICNYSYKTDFTDTIPHDYALSEITTPPTHTTEGIKTLSCNCGASYTESIPKTEEHNYNQVITEPTCTEKGYTTYTCECGDTYVDNYVDAVGHYYFYTTETLKPATHTSTGLLKYICVCGISYTVTTDKTQTHSYTKYITKEATHLETGLYTYKCYCGDSYQTVIPKIEEHSYTTVVTAPTCASQGYTKYTCACGDSYIDDYVDAYGHTYEAVITAPTCTEKGYTTYTCDCGDSYVSDYVEEKGHSYISEITTPATHFTEGLRTFTCECGNSYTEVIKIIPHDYATETIYPTCSTEGYTIYTCECGDTYNDDYVGYDYSAHVNEDGDGLCDYCGELATDCSCNCHSTNSFIAFFWKILNFLQRLFGTNPVCSCGMAHY